MDTAHPPRNTSTEGDGRNIPGKPPSPPNSRSWHQVATEGRSSGKSNRVMPEEINRLRGVFKEKVIISKTEIEEARKPWRCALVGHFIGRQRDSDFVARSLGRQWKTLGDVEIIPLTDGFFTFRFACEEDMHRVWTGGPWTVGGMVLSLQEWKPCFRPSRNAIPKAAVWVRLPKLPIELMTRDWVLNLVSRAGKPIDVDVSTKNLSRGSFARACIEIDLAQPLVPSIPVEIEGDEEFWQEFVYERIDVFCFQCGRIGHRRVACTRLIADHIEIANIDGVVDSSNPPPSPSHQDSNIKLPEVNLDSNHPSNPQPSEAPEDLFGPWLTVLTMRSQRRKVVPKQGHKSNSPSAVIGGAFATLNHESSHGSGGPVNHSLHIDSNLASDPHNPPFVLKSKQINRGKQY